MTHNVSVSSAIHNTCMFDLEAIQKSLLKMCESVILGCLSQHSTSHCLSHLIGQEGERGRRRGREERLKSVAEAGGKNTRSGAFRSPGRLSDGCADKNSFIHSKHSTTRIHLNLHFSLISYLFRNNPKKGKYLELNIFALVND